MYLKKVKVSTIDSVRKFHKLKKYKLQFKEKQSMISYRVLFIFLRNGSYNLSKYGKLLTTNQFSMFLKSACF